jgi:hypothetical protein
MHVNSYRAQPTRLHEGRPINEASGCARAARRVDAHAHARDEDAAHNPPKPHPACQKFKFQRDRHDDIPHVEERVVVQEERHGFSERLAERVSSEEVRCTAGQPLERRLPVPTRQSPLPCPPSFRGTKPWRWTCVMNANQKSTT